MSRSPTPILRSNMTLRFSSDGPEFPGEFVDAVLAGEVVFLCGTGVSAPQMPGFASLVERTYAELGVEMTESEQKVFEENRFEEVLGSLSRRLADPEAVTRTVSTLLAVPLNPALAQHRVILRLSRDLENRIAVVTTNFDTLFERAAVPALPLDKPGDISFAGQSLPAPGSPSFAGIVHLHGRLADDTCGLEATPLVLTSADYGDAYMRSGWASRFLFDLARCKTIALVGYSAQDAPVRYFLNVLEADRTRFPDLKPVYAFDGYERDPEETVVTWGSLPVQPLPYCKVNPVDDANDHSLLWRGLEELAEITERPNRSRRQRTRALLKQAASEADDDAKRELRWLFSGGHDVRSVARETITDPRWFTVFQELDLWSTDEAASWIAAWVAKDFQDRVRFECACEWQRRLGRPFTESIERHLLRADGLPATWVRLWKLFCRAVPGARDDGTLADVRRRLAATVVLDGDLCMAVHMLSPGLVLQQSFRASHDDDAEKPIGRLADLVFPNMAIRDRYEVSKLAEALCELPRCARRILDLATSELTAVLELEVELELIGEKHDVNDSGLPSIESHPQNELRQGVKFLVAVLVRTLAQVATTDREHARSVAKAWRHLPGRIGLRLCLHAMRDTDLFDADEAMETLLEASDLDFWVIKREVVLLLRDRVAGASPSVVGRVEERVRTHADEYYARYVIGPGEPDWRQSARDSAVWLRLSILEEAGVLSECGARELSVIKGRRDHLNRTVGDRDSFSSYISGGRFVSGDPKPIAEAATSNRLQVARHLAQSVEFEAREGWSVYCGLDPEGAFRSLCGEKPSPANGGLWNTFLEALAFGEQANTQVREELAVQSFRHLRQFSPKVLTSMVSGLALLIFRAPRERVAYTADWLDRLWKIAPDPPPDSFGSSSDWYERAINSEAGKVAETLLLEIEARRKNAAMPTRAQRRLLGRICRREGMAGQLGRAVLAHHVSFLTTVDRQFVVEDLGPRISATDEEGAAMRAVMLRASPLSAEVTRLLGDAVKLGLIESSGDDLSGLTVAANMLRMALADVRGQAPAQWGLTAGDVAQILKRGRQGLRVDALDVLRRWLDEGEASAEENWRTAIGPFLDAHWPKERAYLESSLTRHWVELVTGTGCAFPAAFQQLRPYIAPFQGGYGSLDSIETSRIPEKFPSETLDLLWLVCGPESRERFYGLPEILDRLVAAESRLEVDRRLQWLIQHATG